MIAFYLIAIGVGLFMIAVAVFDWDDWFYDADSRVIEMIGGASMVRWYWGGSGVLVVIATIAEWIWGWPLGHFLGY